MRGKYLLLATLMATTTATAEQDLGLITVESSTIVDMDVNKTTEASTVNIIDEQTIKQIDPKNINDLLQTIPGITADVRNNVVEIHMRGIGQQEFMWEDTGVAIVIDGVPVLQDGGKVRFNMNEIESIKVIKGGASYLYGNTALAGAVIITTKKNKTQKGGDITIETGSESYRNYKTNFHAGTDSFSYNIMSSYKEEDGYWYNSASDESTFNGLFTYYLSDSSDISFGMDYIDGYEQSGRGSVTGVTEAETNPTAEGDYSWSADQDIELQKYFVKYNKDLANGGNILLHLYYYKDKTSYKSSPIDTSGDVNASGDLVYDGTDDDYARQRDEDVKQYGLKAEYRGETDHLAYLLGTDIGQRNSEEYSTTVLTGISSRDSLYFAGETSYDNDKEDRYALYGETKYRLNPDLTVIFNARYDHDKYTTEEEDHETEDGITWTDTTSKESVSYDNFSYRIGTTYNLQSGGTLYANISTGFRNPKVRQYSDNHDIDQETSITYELGLRGKLFDTFSYEASVYVTDTDDIIGKVNGTYYFADDPYYDNVGDARTKGLELTLKSDQKKKLSFSLAYTYMDAYYTSHNPFAVDYAPLYRTSGDEYYDVVGNQLPRVPHHKVDFILNYKPTDKWHFMAEFYAQSDYYADETNFVEFDGYTKLNLKATYKPSEDLEIFAKVNNVFDNQYYRTVYLYADKNYNGELDPEDASITVDPGRQIYVGLKYKF